MEHTSVRIQIVEEVTDLIITNSGDRVVLQIADPVIVELLEVGIIGPQGLQGLQGEPGASGGSLITDPNPTLGADLQLNGFVVIGTLENQTFILDGGLLG